MSINHKELVFQLELQISAAYAFLEFYFHKISSPVQFITWHHQPLCKDHNQHSLAHLGKEMLRAATWPNHCLPSSSKDIRQKLRG